MQLTVQQAKFRVCMDLTWDCVGLVQIKYASVILLFIVREQNALHWQALELLFTDDFLEEVCDWRYNLDPFLFGKARSELTTSSPLTPTSSLLHTELRTFRTSLDIWTTFDLTYF